MFVYGETVKARGSAACLSCGAPMQKVRRAVKGRNTKQNARRLIVRSSNLTASLTGQTKDQPQARDQALTRRTADLGKELRNPCCRFASKTLLQPTYCA